MIRDVTNRPLAAAGLISYRYLNRPFPPVMIGARNVPDALNEARRSVSGGHVTIANLQVWVGNKYVFVQEPAR